MAFKEQEKITKNYSEELLTELINYQGDNIMGEIVRLGIQPAGTSRGKNNRPGSEPIPVAGAFLKPQGTLTHTAL